jgi:prophage antirepressor-like protein
MTVELVPLPTFEGREIRVIEKDGTVWMPLVDLAEAWGLHRNTLRDIVQRNEKKFEGFVSTGAHETCAGLTMVDERGLYLLMGAVNTSRLKNPAAADAILRFQRWVPELIQRYRKKEIIQAPALSPLDTELNQARRIAELTDTDPKAMQAAALRKCGLPEYADVLRPVLVHGDNGWYNVTQLCARYPLPEIEDHPERLNLYLKNQGYQYRDQGIWRLQPKGEIHGKEYWYEAPSGHREIRIRWRLSIMYACGLVRDELEPARLGVT